MKSVTGSDRKHNIVTVGTCHNGLCYRCNKADPHYLNATRHTLMQGLKVYRTWLEVLHRISRLSQQQRR